MAMNNSLPSTVA